MCAEVVCAVQRPAHIDIDHLDEYAGPLPLDVHESIYIRAVAVFFDFLVVEHAERRAVSRLVPLGGVGDIGTYLHLHHFLHDIELPVPPRIDSDHRKRNDIVIRRYLEQCPVVEVQALELEVLGYPYLQYADGVGALSCHRHAVVIYVVLQQRPAG